jgi:hypothetical protein
MFSSESLFCGIGIFDEIWRLLKLAPETVITDPG